MLDIPPFIVTLAMMLVASGFAYILSGGQSIYQLPDGFGWLGAGTTFNVPNAVILMLLLYLVAHVVMSHTTLGRYIYATGGNEEAARLSGVPTRKIKVFVYVVAGALAGLGGMIEASQLASGRPNSGLMYELYVIAAVVVGGTSLTGGEGKIFGTLIGAFIIAVIQNGMNLMLVESYTQKVVFGCRHPGGGRCGHDQETGMVQTFSFSRRPKKAAMPRDRDRQFALRYLTPSVWYDESRHCLHRHAERFLMATAAIRYRIQGRFLTVGLVMLSLHFRCFGRSVSDERQPGH